MNSLPFATKLALQSYCKCEDGIVQAHEENVDAWYIDASLHSDMIETWNSYRIDNILSLIDQYKVSPILHSNFKVSVCSDVPFLRAQGVEYIKREIDLCAEIGAPIILHAGAIVEPRKLKQVKKIALNNYLESLCVLKEYAVARSVDIWLENLSFYPNYRPFSYIFCLSEEIEYVLDGIELPLFFDLGHANVNGEDNIQYFIKRFHHRMVGISLSNNNGVIDQHLGLERGIIDYKLVVDTLREHDWSGIVALETRNSRVRDSIDLLKNFCCENINEVH